MESELVHKLGQAEWGKPAEIASWRLDLSLNVVWAAFDDVKQAIEPFRAVLFASECPEKADLPKK